MEFGHHYDERLAKSIRANEVLYREERAEVLRKHSAQRDYELAHTQNVLAVNPYATKISEKSLTTAKLRQQTLAGRAPVIAVGHGREVIELPGAQYEAQLA